MSKYVVSFDRSKHTVSIFADGSKALDGVMTSVDICALGNDSYSVLLEGNSTKVVARKNGSTFQVLLGAEVYDVIVESERDILLRTYAHSTGHQQHRRDILAPMPAMVIRIEVNKGDNVSKGQGLIVLEAMKMENELKAPQDGKVKAILVIQGQTVEKGENLLVLD